MAIIPNTNVNLATNVRDVLNSAGGSVGNALTSFFSASAKLNKWAKYKPVICYNQPFLDDDRRWKGDSGLCGFTSGSIVFNSVDDLVTAYKNYATFVYDIPSGGTAEPMRLGDFRGYCTDAQAPIWDFYINGAFTSSGANTETIDCELVTNSPDTSIELLLSDFAPNGANVADWYFGAVFELNTGTLVTKSSTTKIGSSSNLSTEARIFSVSKSDLGTFTSFKAYPCLCQYSGNNHGLVMALPCAASGGEFSSGGLSGSVVQQQAAVGWVGNTYAYTGGPFVSFRGELGYPKSLEGSTVNITINVWNNGAISTQSSQNYTLAHNSEDDTGSYYRMAFERDTKWNKQYGDSYEMIVLGGSSGVSSTSVPVIKDILPPL